MTKIYDENFYCFAFAPILFGVVGLIPAGLGVAASNYSLFGIFGGTVGNALLGSGGALIAAGLIGLGIPKFQAILIKNNNEKMQATVANKVKDYLNDKI